MLIYIYLTAIVASVFMAMGIVIMVVISVLYYNGKM